MKCKESKTFLKKVKGLLKKGLGEFSQDGAKFSQSLGLLYTKRREIITKTLTFPLKSIRKVRFYDYFPQISRFSNAFSLRQTRAVLGVMNFTRFSRVKSCLRFKEILSIKSVKRHLHSPSKLEGVPPKAGRACVKRIYILDELIEHKR